MKKINISQVYQWKNDKHKFATLTAYDFSFAKLFTEAGINILLVGDSLGMTIQGYDSTLLVTVNNIAYHTSAVRRGAPQALILADLPFMSYATIEQTIDNAAILIRAGANIVKLEGGGSRIAKIVRILTELSIPVCGHLGLTPQSINLLGSYKIQGNNPKSASKILEDAIELEDAGAKLIVLECIPVSLAQIITNTLHIPVIGIGAGNVTDGQILVMHDMLGITSGHTPKFSKNFLAESGNIRQAIYKYIDEVQKGLYPTSEHSYF